MRFTLIAAVFATVLSSASAMRLVTRQGNFPDCAVDCVTNPKSYFGCNPDDNSCLCNSQPYVTQTTQCIVDACNPSDADAAEAYSRELCREVGINLTSTPSLSPTPSSTGSDTGAPALPTSGSSDNSSSAPAGSSPSPSGTTPPTPSNTASGNPNTSGSSTSPAPTNTSNAGVTNSAGTFVGLVALALAALNL